MYPQNNACVTGSRRFCGPASAHPGVHPTNVISDVGTMVVTVLLPAADSMHIMEELAPAGTGNMDVSNKWCSYIDL